MGTCRNRLAGEADDLVVLADRLALRNYPERQLMACRNPFCTSIPGMDCPASKSSTAMATLFSGGELDVLVHGRQ
jgi:hypothetical protein